MNPYERLINVMREQGAVKNPPRLRLGTMVSDSQCDIGTMILEKDDLYVAEHLVDGYEIKIMIEPSEKKQNAKVYHALKKGDVVLLYQIKEEKFVIIEKVVNL